MQTSGRRRARFRTIAAADTRQPAAEAQPGVRRGHRPAVGARRCASSSARSSRAWASPTGAPRQRPGRARSPRRRRRRRRPAATGSARTAASETEGRIGAVERIERDDHHLPVGDREDDEQQSPAATTTSAVNAFPEHRPSPRASVVVWPTPCGSCSQVPTARVIAETVPNASRAVVQPLTHFLAGLEERHALLIDRNVLAGARIAARSAPAGS